MKRLSRARAAESRAARLLDGWVTSEQGYSTPDVLGVMFIAEVKHRTTLPAWLTQAFEQLRGYAKKHPGKLPIIALHEKGKHDMLLLMTATEWARMVKELRNGEYSYRDNK